MANKNFQVKFGLEVGSTVTADAATGNITTSGDVAVNGGDITTTSVTANIVNATATTVNLGGGATTAVNIGNSSGEIITPSDVKQTGNKSIRQGDGPYVGSTDIYRNNAGVAIEGFLISNNNMTNASTSLIGRNYGQSFSGGTTATGGANSLFFGASRGTSASPLATGSNDAFYIVAGNTNYGTDAGTGTGQVWSNDLYPTNAQPAGLNSFANQNHRQTLQATFTGSVSGTTLTVTAVASGTIAPGQELRATGITNTGGAGFVITQQLTTTAAGNALGSTGTYQLYQTPGTIASSTMTTYTIAGGTSARHWCQPQNFVPNTATVANFQLAPNLNAVTGGQILASGYNNFALGPAWYQFPVYNRIVTEITGGNTLNIGTHGFTVGATNLGINVFIQTAGNPNGLVSNTTYYVDTVPSSTTITLRTNSVSGGAVTGLTNGTGLFIIVGTAAQSQTGAKNASTILLTGSRNGQNYQAGQNIGNIRQDDLLGRLQFQGTTSTGTNNNTILAARTTEDWVSGGNSGSSFVLTTTKTGSSNIYDTTISSAATTFTTDSFTVRTAVGSPVNMLTLDSSGNAVVTGDLRINGNDIQASDGNTNITLTSNTLTTFAGDIRINGNDIQNSTGNNTITMQAGAAARTIFAGDIEIDGNNIRTSAGNTAIALTGNNSSTNLFGTNMTFRDASGNPQASLGPVGPRTEFSVNKLDATASNNFATINFNTARSSAGTYTPTQNGDVIGQFKFNGNAVTGSSPSVPAGPGAQITAQANELWSNTANGTTFDFNIIKTGTITGFNALTLSSASSSLRGDQINLQDSSSVGIVSGKIVYNRVFGQWQYDATITPAAANTAYAFPFQGANAVTDYANIAAAVSTSQIKPNATGFFNLQFSIQLENTSGAADHVAYIWWRKNGVDIANSMGRVYVTKGNSTISAWNNVIEATATTDYFELMYAVDNVALIFPYYASTAFGPSTAAAFLSITPVGA